MKQLLVPCDFSNPSIEAFKMAVDIATKSNGTITVLHSIFISTTYDPVIGGDFVTNSQQFFTSMEKDARKAFAQLVEKYGKAQNINFEVSVGGLFDSVTRITDEKGIDLIVIGTTGSSGIEEILIGSNTERVVRFSKVPVLAVRTASALRSIKNILLPTTGNLDQSAFISKAKELQAFLGAKLHILLINTPGNFRRDAEGKEILEEFAKHYQLKNYELHFKNYRQEEEGVLDFAKSNNVDLIAMATHSRTGLSHLSKGSVTEDVINHVPAPVWTFSIRK